MSTVQGTKPQVIRLSSKGGNVVVTPDDEDRFTLTAQNAVKACQDHYRSSEAIKQFKSEFLRPLMEWCEHNAARIHSCFVPVPVGYVQVFVIGASPKYDFELGTELAKLEVSLADAGWRVNVLQIPYSDDEELKTYFDPEGALLVYAKLEAAQG
jgi:hypothetical protein